jgi:hypothetical protein
MRVQRNPVNLRVTKNFEQAINSCTGDVIATADQDDLWYPQTLARIEAIMNAHPNAGLVFSDADVVDAADNRTGSRLWESVRFHRARQINRGRAFEALLRSFAVTGAAMAFRAKYRTTTMPIPDGWLHDAWLGLAIAAVAPLVAIDEPLMAYRRHDSNQVGVPTDPAKRRASSLNTPRDFFLQSAALFRRLQAHLADQQPRRAQQVARKVAHFTARASLPPSRLGRLPLVLRELVTLRYTRYSGTTLAFARDLLSRS